MKTDTPEIQEEILKSYPKDERSIIKILLNMTSTAMKLVSKGALVSEMVGKAVLSSPEQVKMISEAGAYLKDLREVADLTPEKVSPTL